MYYVFQESIISATLQQFTSITCQHPSRILNTWCLYLGKRFLKHLTRMAILVFHYAIVIYVFNTE